MKWLLVLGFLGLGCAKSSSVFCDDGRVCPEGLLCADSVAQCVTEEQKTICQTMGATTGDPCASGDVVGRCAGDLDGAPCTTCVCIAYQCGDGVVSGSEDCDTDNFAGKGTCSLHGFYDGSTVSCTNSCTFNLSGCSRRCGDGHLDSDVGELCDGAPPFGSCVDFGFDAGSPNCQTGGCSPNFESCVQFAWRPVVDTSDVSINDGYGGVLVGFVGSKDDATAVAFLFDGIGWARHDTGRTIDNAHIWASNATDIYVVGETASGAPGMPGRLTHYNGTQWDDQQFAAKLDYVWGASATEVFVFSGDQVYRGSGTTWTAQTVAGLTGAISVWGSSASNVYMISSDRILRRFDGNAWSTVTVPGSATLFMVDGNAANDVVVADNGAGAFRWDGNAWTNILPGGHSQRVDYAGPGDLYVLGTPTSTSAAILHRDAQAKWAQVNVGSALTVAAGIGVFDVAGGTIRRYGGSVWQSALFTNTTNPAARPMSFALRSDDFIAQTAGAAVPGRFDFVTQMNLGMSGATVNFAAVAQIGANVYAAANPAVSTTQLYMLTGTTWATVGPTSTTSVSSMLGGTDADHIFVTNGASAGIRRFSTTGNNWTTEAGINNAYDRIACAGSACVATGYDTNTSTQNVAVWNGTAWTESTVAEEIFGLAASSATDFWAVNRAKQLGHFDGTSWTWTNVPSTTGFVTSVAAMSPTDVYIGGKNGFLTHFDGTRWARITSSTSADIMHIAVTPLGLVLLLEDLNVNGNFYHYVYRLVRTYAWP